MAERRFHINPETGNANICRAVKPENCRYSGQEHYGSREEAQSAYEVSQSQDLFADSRRPPVKVEINEDGYLLSEFASQVAPQGIYCPHCGRGPNHLQAKELIGNEYAYCECGGRYDLGDVKVELKPDHPSYKFIQDKNEVLKATWYHATDDENWLSEIRDEGVPFEAHMGTEAAAFDRGITNYALHGSYGQGFMLYEVELDPESNVSDEVARDENNSLLTESDADVVRYLNLWEDMASVSLAVKPEKVRIKSKRPVTKDEAHRRITPYNVAPEPYSSSAYWS